MKNLDNNSWSSSRRNSKVSNTHRWSYLLLLLAGFLCSNAQADLVIDTITQSPTNPVTVGVTASYQVNVHYEGNSAGDYPQFKIFDNDIEVTDSFSSPDCGLDGYYYCSSVTSSASFNFSWINPPSIGTHNIIFELTCSGTCNGDSQFITTTVVNPDIPSSPVANAGPDQIVNDINNDGSESVTLDGSGSTDADNDIASYEWFEGKQSLGTGATLAVNLTSGSHTLRLLVTDEQGNTDQDYVDIIVYGIPVANAGPDQSFTVTNNNETVSVNLNGSASTNPNNDILYYNWYEGEMLLGSGVNLTIENLSIGTHTITLEVYDSYENISYDDVIISVTVNNPIGEVAPIANAGQDQIVTDTNNDGVESVTVNGSRSVDANNDIASYEWFESQQSLGTGVNLTVNLALGAHTLRLLVTDERGNTSEDNVNIIVKEGSQSAPVANAGSDQTITDTNNDGSESVTLDGSGSTDADNDIASYEWFEGQQSLGTGVNLSINLALGSHTLRLLVSDEQGNTDEDNVDIFVNAAPQSAPVANAGPDQTVTDTNNDGSEPVTVDGSGSTDADNDIVSYEWFENEQSLGTGQNLTVNLAVGTHTLTLLVTDQQENTSNDVVSITVVESAEPLDEDSTIEVLTGENQQLTEGDTSNPLAIRVTGPDGQPLAGTTITWVVIPADAATLDNNTTSTDSNGESTNRVRLTANRAASTFKVSASIPSGASARFQINPIAGISGLTQTQRSIAGSLDNACPAVQASDSELSTEEQSLLALCDYLATASDQEIISALQQLLPDEIAAQGRNTITFARTRNKHILHRLGALRNGVTGPSLENISISIQGEQLPSFVIRELTKSQRGGAAAADSSSIASRFGVFANGNISFGDTDTTANEAGFEFKTNGLTLGSDYRFSDQFVLGGALNYISTNSEYIGQSSTLDISGYSLSMYGSYYGSERAFVDGIMSFGLNKYDNDREYTIASINQNLQGNTDGSEFALSFGGGYEFNYQNISFVPQARINYLRVDVDGYQETSSTYSGLSMDIGNQNIESLIATISGSMSLAYSTQYGVFIPSLSFDWEHEFKNDGRAIIASFVSDSTNSNFSVLTDDPDQDYFYLGLGLTAALTEGRSAFVQYENMLGHKDTSQYTITGGFRIEF